jgi:hypothetical protein
VRVYLPGVGVEMKATMLPEVAGTSDLAEARAGPLSQGGSSGSEGAQNTLYTRYGGA